MANKTKYKRSKLTMIGTMQNYKAPLDEYA